MSEEPVAPAPTATPEPAPELTRAQKRERRNAIPWLIGTVLMLLLLAGLALANSVNLRRAKEDGLVRGVESTAAACLSVVLSQNQGQATRIAREVATRGRFEDVSIVVNNHIWASSDAANLGTKLDGLSEQDVSPRLVPTPNGTYSVRAPIMAGENNVAGWLVVSAKLE